MKCNMLNKSDPSRELKNEGKYLLGKKRMVHYRSCNCACCDGRAEHSAAAEREYSSSESSSFLVLLPYHHTYTTFFDFDIRTTNSQVAVASPPATRITWRSLLIAYRHRSRSRYSCNWLLTCCHVPATTVHVELLINYCLQLYSISNNLVFRFLCTTVHVVWTPVVSRLWTVHFSALVTSEAQAHGR